MTAKYLRLLHVTAFLSLLLPFVTCVCSRFENIHLAGTTGGSLKLWIGLFAGLAIYGLFAFAIRPATNAIDRSMRRQVEALDGLGLRQADVGILISAAVSLFLELSIIRWQSEVFPVFAFYKNYSLLSCFAGLGIGYALARQDRLPLLFSIPILAFQFLLLFFLRYGMSEWQIGSILQTPFSEQLNMGTDVAGNAAYLFATYFFLAVVSLLTAMAFLPIGQLCGRLMSRRNDLKAYGLNLLGSIGGVAGVTFLSWFWTPPVVWFSLCFAVLIHGWFLHLSHHNDFSKIRYVL